MNESPNSDPSVAFYTGPLQVCATLSQIHHPCDTGANTVVIMGLAMAMLPELHDTTNLHLLRVRMEITPEDAIELAKELVNNACIARRR